MEEAEESYKALCTSETLRSGKKGFFHEFSECVRKSAGDAWLRKSFGRLESEEDRVRSVFVEEKIKGVVVETLSRAKILFRDKDREIAKRRRLEGVEAASKGAYEKALLYLSQAVLRAPCKDREYDLPLALLERAKVFVATMEYDLALDDLNEAARYNLPEEPKSEISRIKERCEWSSVCPSSVGKVGKVRKVRKELEPPRLTAGENPELPGASTLLEIRETLAAGKHAVAASEILPGDVLIVEPPLTACLLPEFFGTHCQHCFSRLRAPIGCPDCSSVAFCGKNCRDAALASYHKYECKILALLIGSGMSVLSMLALRMITQEGPRNCREISRVAGLAVKTTPSLSKSARRRCRRKKLREFRYGKGGNGGDGDKRAYELVTHRERRSPDDWLERSLMAIFLLKCLQRVDFFETPSRDDEVPSDQEIAVGGLLLKNLQLLQFNAHEFFETRIAREHRFRGSKPIYLGVAIYPTVARFNHDCYPAVTRYFVGRNIVIRATRVLKPGEVVAENYGPIFTKRTLQERQRELSGRYWFRCNCISCRENWPQFPNLSNDMVKFKCPTSGCERVHSRAGGRKGSGECPRCKRVVNLADRIADLEECEELYNEGFAKMEEEKALEAIEIFRDALIKFHRICVPPHKETHLAEIALSSCMASFGNAWRPPSLG